MSPLGGQGCTHRHQGGLGEANETAFIPLLTGLSKLTRASGGRKEVFWRAGDGYSPSWHGNTINNGSRSLK